MQEAALKVGVAVVTTPTFATVVGIQASGEKRVFIVKPGRLNNQV